MQIRKHGIFLIAVCLLVLLTSCSKNDSAGETGEGTKYTLAISGSTSVGPLTEKLAAKYEEKEDIKIEINQIGSSAGITNAINGVSEIGMSSRDLKRLKRKKVWKRRSLHDGIVVIVHPSNKVDDLTLEQVRDILQGKSRSGKNWAVMIWRLSLFPGKTAPAPRCFQEIVGYSSGELVKSAIIASGNGNIKTTVATNKHAIGFISFEYIDPSVRPVKIEGIEPTAENVLQQKYKLSRPFLFVYLEENLSPQGRKFIDFILSSEGQRIVLESGTIPVR